MDQPTQAVLKLARSVLERLEVEAVLERLLDSARELTGARYAALGVLNQSGTGLSRFLTVGIDESTRRLIGPLPSGRGVLGELIRDPKPLRLSDVGSHPYSYGFPVGHPPMRTSRYASRRRRRRRSVAAGWWRRRAWRRPGGVGGGVAALVAAAASGALVAA